MLKEISKKLALKKTFFSTQLDGFFNAITQEYQELIHQKELENAQLISKCEKLEKDVANLVNIKNELTKALEIEKKLVSSLQQELHDIKNNNFSLEQERDLLAENEKLKQEIENLKLKNSNDTTENEEIQKLKQRIKHLQEFIAKGGAAYGESIITQKSEQIIKEISEELKR